VAGFTTLVSEVVVSVVEASSTVVVSVVVVEEVVVSMLGGILAEVLGESLAQPKSTSDAAQREKVKNGKIFISLQL
jgi:hypothetical protein